MVTLPAGPDTVVYASCHCDCCDSATDRPQASCDSLWLDRPLPPVFGPAVGGAGGGVGVGARGAPGGRDRGGRCHRAVGREGGCGRVLIGTVLRQALAALAGERRIAAVGGVAGGGRLGGRAGTGVGGRTGAAAGVVLRAGRRPGPVGVLRGRGLGPCSWYRRCRSAATSPAGCRCPGGCCRRRRRSRRNA